MKNEDIKWGTEPYGCGGYRDFMIWGDYRGHRIVSGFNSNSTFSIKWAKRRIRRKLKALA